MRILFAISLVALAALLWASVSIAQHIYRSRKHHKAVREPKLKDSASSIHVASQSARQSSTAERDTNSPQRKAS